MQAGFMSNSTACDHIAENAGMHIISLDAARAMSTQLRSQSDAMGLPYAKAMAEQILQVLGESQET